MKFESLEQFTEAHPDIVQEVEATHPFVEWFFLKTMKQVVGIIPAGDIALKAYLKGVAGDDKNRLQAMQDFVFMTVVYPPREALQQVISRKKGIVLPLAGKCGEVAGLAEEIEAKKE